MKRYVKSTSVDAKSALSQFDPIRKLLGEKEWYTIEEYLLNGDKKYSLKDILYDEKAWDAYADWKMRKYHEKPALAASTRIKARRYLTASTNIGASIDSDITKYKKSLTQKAAKSGIWENFGAAEIRKLKDKYSVYPDDNTDYRTAEHNRRSIDSFEDWCMNYVGASTCVKAAAEGNYNKLIKRIDQDGYTCFIIQSGDEPDYWYWCVDTAIVDRYKGTDQKFINDYDNSSEGSSCASFATPEEAEADFRGE